ncbi:hypothetical protein GQF61_05435 [Sphingobacterium sp. DK4209]|uniref:O-antigen ligase domain-containing protein n=1 Tax=Sphingobacterium zhuxiongii TaxID=2662364 RepID=A0A5Q0QF26_9SPHI|nr:MULTISPECIES: hypothetical protein [unclassified Sphingobacterium]MVZ65288.1 hypothetical protein [Sphingobacterium sp. DK4209]QGA26378.1 hypothetical protein GFH32_08580 [Sphingobacterium sp. dk4302]
MRIILFIFVGILVSFFYFPFEFTFLPKGLNTKIMLAVIGLPLMLYHMIKMRKTIISKEILFSSLIALVFSIVGLYSVDLNHTDDYAYANYISSMWVWLGAAYTVITAISTLHNKLSIRIVVNYFIVVCVTQCVLALVIDFVPAVKMFVDRYFDMGITVFLNEVDRLYGIGAALDVAGVRFSAVLIMITILLINNPHIKNNPREIYFYSFAYLILVGIGNMISRTTVIGFGISAAYLFFSANIIKQQVENYNVKMWKVIIVSILFIAFVGVYFYQTNAAIYDLLRFGFEGFFNWVEKGEFRTDSTDRLNTVMWIWPEAGDWQTWIIGKATFSNWWAVGTDIGYCRFVFYCGLIGLSVFIFFFLYLSVALWNKFKIYRHLFLLLFVLALINWLKVSTDIFLVYAIFLAIGSPYLYERYYDKAEDGEVEEE